MIIWLVTSTDGGRDASLGKVYSRPSTARLDLRELAERIPAAGFPLSQVIRDFPDEDGWHRFIIESEIGDTVELAAKHIEGSSYDWPLESGQVLYAQRMLNDVIQEANARVQH